MIGQKTLGRPDRVSFTVILATDETVQKVVPINSLPMLNNFTYSLVLRVFGCSGGFVSVFPGGFISVVSFQLFRLFRGFCSGGFVSVFRVLVHAHEGTKEWCDHTCQQST